MPVRTLGEELEHALGIAFDYLRSCCEALIEEVLFAGTIERHTEGCAGAE